MPQTSSDFVVKVSTQGVEQARRALESLEQATTGVGFDQSRAFASAAQSLEKVVASADKLCAKLDQVAHSMLAIGRTSDAVAAKAVGATTAAAARSGGASALDVLNHMKAANPGYFGPHPAAPEVAKGNAVDVLRRMQSENPGAFGARTQPLTVSQRLMEHSGAFGFGFAKSALPGPLAMVARGRGAIPEMMGLAAGNMAMHLASAPFSGAQGLVGALGSVPLVGGMMAAPLANYMGQADQVMAFQRQQVELAPLLGNLALDENLRPMGSSRSTAMGPPLPPAATDAIRRARMGAAVTERGRDAARLLGQDISGGQRFAAALEQSGASVSDLEDNSNYVNNAMAAQSRLGVGTNVSGAFGLGARTGAFAGQKNADPGQMLMRAINQSNQLGLRGTEQQQYLQDIAEGIRNIERTGIPFQMDTVRNLQSAFTGFSGMSSRSAHNMAIGAQQRSSDFADNGPQDAFDMQVLRAGGFTGGLRSLYDTREKFQKDPEFYAKSQLKVLGQVGRSPIASKNRLDVKRIAALKMGIVDPNFSPQFADSQLNPAKAEAAQKDLAEKIAAVNKAAPTDQTSLDFQSGTVLPKSMTRQAAMANTTIAAGGDAVNVMLNASEVSNKLGNELGNFGGILNSVSEALHSVGMSVFGGNSGGAAPPDVRPAH